MSDKPLRAVVWAAVSTRAQTDDDRDSLPLQLEHGREMAHKLGLEVIDALEVPGHSRRYLDIHELAKHAREEGIDAFDKLIKLIKQKAFDVLIVRDGDRFARTQALHAYITESIINMGGKLYSLADGWVTEENYRMWIAMSGYKASKDVDELVKKRRNAMNAIAAKGLPTSYAPHMAHKVEYDPVTRKAIRQVLDESKAQLWQYIYELVVNQRIAWVDLERELYNRYAIVNPNTGKWYARQTFYQMLYKPGFWGHTGRYYDGLGTGQRWVYDDDIEPPAGVMLFRHTIPPVFTGEQAERLKAELRRREDTAHGRSKTNTNYAFTGLLMCDVCRTMLTVKPTTHPLKDGSNRTWVYYRCSEKASSFREVKCNQRNIHHATIVAALDKLLAKVIQTGDLSLIYNIPKQSNNERDFLIARIAELEEQKTDDMASQRASRVPSVKAEYRELIDKAAEQIEILKGRLAELEAETANNDELLTARQALSDLKEIGLPALWQQTTGYQNQVLHALFGRQKLLVRDGEIVGIDTYRQRKGGGKRYKKKSS
jgi:DNA invertase Pin-like site-specific DNA recombinase